MRYNAAVQKVEQGDTGVTVTTSDGRTLQAKYLIMTASLGILKTDAIQFTPELPAAKKQAIHDMVRGENG